MLITYSFLLAKTQYPNFISTSHTSELVGDTNQYISSGNICLRNQLEIDFVSL